MRVLSAEAVDGQLDLPQGAAKEGPTLMVPVPDGEENPTRLSPEGQARLRMALEPAGNGELSDGSSLLEELKH